MVLIIAKDKKKGFILVCSRPSENLNKPIVPILIIILARIIEQFPEAETCTLVNHK